MTMFWIDAALRLTCFWGELGRGPYTLQHFVRAGRLP